MVGLGRQGNGGGRAGGSGVTRRVLLVLPGALIVLGLVFDVLTPPSFTGSPFFTAAPLIAAPLFTLWATALTGGLAVCAVFLLHLLGGTSWKVEALTELVTVLTVAGLALLINRMVRRSGERLASARGIAEAAQRAVLPKPAERIGGLHVSAWYEAAQADAFIGGDLYAVQETPYGVRLAVGDVRGKGLGAVEAVAVVLGAFREAADTEPTLEALAQRLERALAREGTRRDSLDAVEGFTTCVLGEVPPGEGVLRLLNRGHPEPLLLHGNGELAVLTPVEPALPLGMGELGGWPDLVQEWAFPAGTTLLLYTDGLTEARDGAGDFYDPAARLRGRIFPGPQALLSALSSDVRRHTGGGATDDMALLAVGRPGEREPERRRTVPVVPRGDVM
ncbi:MULTISPECIES: PP2C family protein-serine/threonine phosphatase [Streptomyces]|uniref:Membrane protein n=1 Tax=Streptomyces spororaveus TaxID=284039 RepID=A0ABQ3TFT5_9ACTN|nr:MULTISPECIES: PP2C family protein-serine/threonine phosphatase [Streptomyces]MCM9080423.1 serine/threonine-protein phosphatase [Streptomyces spororaveus]MCX5305158.1 serine/threonine-protein phosphatase [Streptomyces sp. NBC_00160]GHI79251.1 membrane protein [Streptomyces spororaveus]